MVRNSIDSFSKNGLEKIRNVKILDSEDFAIVESLSTELQNTFEKKQVFRTETEMKFSVLNDLTFPTLASKYWQSVKEQDVMYTNLCYTACDYEIEQGKLELMEIELDEIDRKTRKGMARWKIKLGEIKKLQFSLVQMRLEAKDRVRELNEWSKIKSILCKKEKFDTENVNSHQLESYRQRYTNERFVANKTKNSELEKQATASLLSIQNKDIIYDAEEEFVGGDVVDDKS